MTSNLRALFVGVTAFLACAPAAAAPAVQCGDVLLQSVTLTADVVCGPAVDGLTIGADNVRIDLNGYRIVGPWTIYALHPVNYGVRSTGFQGVGIIGPGKIAGFASPFRIEGKSDHRVSDVMASEPLGYHADLQDVSRSVVERSTFNGLMLRSRATTTAAANTISGNRIGASMPLALWGGGWLVLSGCGTRENLIADNEILESPWSPRFQNLWANVWIGGGARGNTVRRNRIAGSLAIAGGSGNKVAENSIEVDPYTAPYAVAILSYADLGPDACGKDAWASTDNEVSFNVLTHGRVSVQLGMSSP